MKGYLWGGGLYVGTMYSLFDMSKRKLYIDAQDPQTSEA